MSRKSLVEREKKRARLVERYKDLRKELKGIVRSLYSTDDERARAIARLCALPRNSSKVRIRNRCRITGRARGYYRKFGVSRLCLRELALAGFIPGMVKASW